MVRHALAPSLENKRTSLHGKTHKVAGFEAPLGGWFWALSDTIEIITKRGDNPSNVWEIIRKRSSHAL
jgi:hypothetical protein